MKNSRKFARQRGERRYHTLFVIAVEGEKTERQYFDIFNQRQSSICIKCLKNDHSSSPPSVLKKMINYLHKEQPDPPFEAWIVVDKDTWKDEQLDQVHKWSTHNNNYNFALSNPAFELWLLLHFEDVHDIKTTKDCIHKLKQYIPSYNKSIRSDQISNTMITNAIERAKNRDNPPCADWPRTAGVTTVYKLVEHILNPS